MQTRVRIEPRAWLGDGRDYGRAADAPCFALQQRRQYIPSLPVSRGFFVSSARDDGKLTRQMSDRRRGLLRLQASFAFFYDATYWVRDFYGNREVYFPWTLPRSISPHLIAP